MVIGGPGTGKSHLASYLAENFRGSRGRVGLVSADPGQPSLGGPTCAALALEPPWNTPEAMWFVGDVSPRGHLLQTVVGTARLAARARDGGAATVVIDPSGLAQGALGSLLKYHKAVAAGVDEVVAIQLDAELEPLLALLSGPCRAIHRLAPVAEATDRSRDERRAARRAFGRRALLLALRGHRRDVAPGTLDPAARLVVVCEKARGEDDPALHRTSRHGLEVLGPEPLRLGESPVVEAQHEAILVQAGEHVAADEGRRVAEHLSPLDAARDRHEAVEGAHQLRRRLLPGHLTCS